MQMGESSYRHMENGRLSVVLVGAGNVATHLGKALSQKANILQIYSRKMQHAQELANIISDKCHATNDPTELLPADLYIISIKDDAIADFLKSVPSGLRERLWVHTSGSVDISVFYGFNKHNGIIYPLQTFSKNVELKMDEVPLFIEGADSDTENFLVQFAHNISPIVHVANSELRCKLHIAAVFACNFTNYMYSISEDILNKSGIPFSVLIPLIKETTRKIELVSPSIAQTGPAARGDKKIIDKHLSAISEPGQKQIYQLLSNSILNKYINNE